MFSGRHYIFYSTLIAVFSDRLLVTVGSVHLLYFYVILIVNLTILAATGWLWLPRKLLLFLGYLFASGLLGILLGRSSMVGLSKSIVGIVVSALYYPAFLRFVEFDSTRCFRVYASLAFYAALFGIFYFPFQSTNIGRLASVFLEPSGFCLVCLPATLFYADQWQRERTGGWRCLVIIAAVLLTVSSLGFLGLLFATYLFGMRYKRGRWLAPAIAIGLGCLIYASSSYFRLRLDDSVQSIVSSDVGESNDSSFGVVVNLFVTQQTIAKYPLIGGGLGSYVVSHARFFGKISGTEFIDREELLTLGQWDASSLLLRLIAEFGLLGLGLSFWFLWHYYPRGGNSIQRIIAQCIICYIFLKFVRSGNYFNPEEFFFFTIYVVNGLMSKTETPIASPLGPARLLPSDLTTIASLAV